MGGVTMNDNIDLTKILKGCPKGTEFYHIGFGKVWFVGIDLDLDNEYSSERPILFSLHNDTYYADTSLTKKGTFSMLYEGECLIFPSKDQRDWAKFERFWDKPKVEKFDVNTLQPFDKVLTRCDDSEKWDIDLFGYFDNLYKGVCCLDAYLQMCIPYNDETKHLVGTNKEAPEYYRDWEE